MDNNKKREFHAKKTLNVENDHIIDLTQTTNESFKFLMHLKCILYGRNIANLSDREITWQIV